MSFRRVANTGERLSKGEAEANGCHYGDSTLTANPLSNFSWKFLCLVIILQNRISWSFDIGIFNDHKYCLQPVKTRVT